MAGELYIVAPQDDADGDRVQWRLGGLRQDLLGLDIDQVGVRAAGPAPEGSRAGVVDAVGSLVVTLVPTLPLLEGIVHVVRTWLGTFRGRSVVLEIDGHRLEVAGVDDAEQRRLADVWIAAVTADRR
ncbi:hypothetical protein [Streptomyces sp. NPDC001970]